MATLDQYDSAYPEENDLSKEPQQNQGAILQGHDQERVLQTIENPSSEVSYTTMDMYLTDKGARGVENAE